MQVLEAEYKNELTAGLEAPVPDFRAGDYLRLTLDDGSTPRPESAKVLVIGRSHRGPRSSFTVLRGHGEEVWRETYPLYCPEIRRIEVIGTMPRRPRQAKLHRLWRDQPTVLQLGLDAKSDEKQAMALKGRERRQAKREARASQAAR